MHISIIYVLVNMMTFIYTFFQWIRTPLWQCVVIFIDRLHRYPQPSCFIDNIFIEVGTADAFIVIRKKIKRFICCCFTIYNACICRLCYDLAVIVPVALLVKSLVRSLIRSFNKPLWSIIILCLNLLITYYVMHRLILIKCS